MRCPFVDCVVRDTLCCRRCGASTSCDWEEGDNRKVTGSGECVFPVVNRDDRDWPVDSVRIQAGLMHPSFLFSRTVGRLGGRLFIKDVGDGLVSAIAVSRAVANSCQGSDRTGATDCPVQGNGREDIVGEPCERCLDPSRRKETEDHR